MKVEVVSALPRSSRLRARASLSRVNVRALKTGLVRKDGQADTASSSH